MNYCADTWFILKLYLQDSRAKQIILEVLQNKAHLALPILAYAEAIKKLHHNGVSSAIISDFFDTLTSSEKINIINLDQDIAREGALLSLHNNIPMIDALIAASAKNYNCSVILTADMHYQPLVKKKYLQTLSW